MFGQFHSRDKTSKQTFSPEKPGIKLISLNFSRNIGDAYLSETFIGSLVKRIKKKNYRSVILTLTVDDSALTENGLAEYKRQLGQICGAIKDRTGKECLVDDSLSELLSTDLVVDRAKALEVYYQGHKTALAHPRDKISFDFYSWATDYYNLNDVAEHLPESTKLHLYGLDDDQLFALNRGTQGTKALTKDFQHQLDLMREAANPSSDFFLGYKKVYVVSALKLNFLRDYSLLSSIDSRLSKFDRKIQRILELLPNLPYGITYKTKPFLFALQNLHAALEANIREQKSKGIALEKIFLSPASCIALCALEMIRKLTHTDSMDLSNHAIKEFADRAKRTLEQSKGNLNTEIRLFSVLAGVLVGLGCSVAYGLPYGAAGLPAGYAANRLTHSICGLWQTPDALMLNVDDIALTGAKVFQPS